MKDQRSLPALGGSSLLTIFAVLCLVTFSLLSISTAQSQRGLSQAGASAVEEYYQADARAEGLLAALRRGEVPPEVTLLDAQEGKYAFTCSISQEQQLEVEVCVDGSGGYSVLRWQAVYVAPWEPEGGLGVWLGDEF